MCKRYQAPDSSTSLPSVQNSPLPIVVPNGTGIKKIQIARQEQEMRYKEVGKEMKRKKNNVEKEDNGGHAVASNEKTIFQSWVQYLSDAAAGLRESSRGGS